MKIYYKYYIYMENKNVIINLKSNNTEKLENRLYNYLLNKNIIYGNSNKINLNKSKILNKKNCKSPISGSVQNITICKNKTYKGPVKAKFINYFKLKINLLKNN